MKTDLCQVTQVVQVSYWYYNTVRGSKKTLVKCMRPLSSELNYRDLVSASSDESG